MKIAKKWKWAAKDADGTAWFFIRKPYIFSSRSDRWTQDGSDNYIFSPFTIPGPWRKSLHKRVGDEWVRVDD